MAAETKACSTPGCHRAAKTRGFCRGHYNYYILKGTLPKLPKVGPEVRFWSYVNRDGGPDACWPWTGAKVRTYGQFNGHRGVGPAHRFAFEIAKGPIPAGLNVLHRCDNPPCVNPAHLFLGTQLDNIRDMVAKGRQGSGRGEHSGMSKLTEAAVIRMRLLRSQGMTHREIAEDAGVCVSQAGKVCRGQAWKHVG